MARKHVRPDETRDLPSFFEETRQYCRTAWNTLPQFKHSTPQDSLKKNLSKIKSWLEVNSSSFLKEAKPVFKKLGTVQQQMSASLPTNSLQKTIAKTRKNLEKNLPKPRKTVKISHTSGTIFKHSDLLTMRQKIAVFIVWAFFPENTFRYRLPLPSSVRKAEKQARLWMTQQLHRASAGIAVLASIPAPSIKKVKLPRFAQLPKPLRAGVETAGEVLQPVSVPTKKALDTVLFPFKFVMKEFPLQVVGSLMMSAGIMLGAYGLYDYVFRDLPEAADLIERDQIVSTKIFDRDGELLFSIYKDENRTIIPLSDVPEHVKNATIAIEDQDFYRHHGFSLRGITRAFIANSRGEPVQGGSTITQQLVKNTLLTPERSLRRKIREVLLAVIVDGSFTKDQILEMYFNEIPYGGAVYGIEEASQRYFGKSAKDLSLAEGAFLAGLPAAPTAYSPFGSTPELAFARQREVLRRMVEDEFITQAEADEAASTQLVFQPDRTDIIAPHFVMYVRRLLAEQYGDDILTQGGLNVRTTLDLDVQEIAQQAVTDEVDSLQRLRVSNGAALVTNPKTGEILAMVGSRDYFDFENDGQVNVVLRPRQPGSSIKPLTYATAMERGLITPSSIIDDSPVRYDIPGSPPYAPKNYDGKFRGRVTVRESLASSYNVPAVKTLAMVGVDTVINKGEDLGISTWTDRDRFGLSLTLGGGEVLMLDMAQLYSAFANYGYDVAPNPILEVTNYRGETLYQNTCALVEDNCFQDRDLDPRIAFQITDILQDNRARTPAFGPQSVLNIPGQEVAVKTGTTNSLRDNWTIGFTSDTLVATWVGNNDNTPMSYVASGITGASPIWNNIIRSLLSEDHPHTFPEPEGLKQVKICKTTGTLTCQGCPWVEDEWFIPGTEPTRACNPAQFRPKPSPSPSDPNNPEQSAEERDQILEGISF